MKNETVMKKTAVHESIFNQDHCRFLNRTQNMLILLIHIVKCVNAMEFSEVEKKNVKEEGSLI